MIDVDSAAEYGKAAGAVIAAVGAFLIGALRGRGWIKKKSSEDDVAIATDAAEVGILQRALDEAERQRVRADAANAERNQAVQELGGLRVQVASLEQHRIDCERRIANMETQIEAMRKLIDDLVRGKQ